MIVRFVLLAVMVSSLPLTAEPDPRTAPLAKEHPLYLEVNAPLEDRVADLVGRLTLEEKARALNHNGADVERIGLRSDKWNQCLNGVQWDRSTTLFPTCIAMAATWDPAFVRDEIVRALSDEARAIYNRWHLEPDAPGQHKGLIYRDPVINIERNPYWGRNHEAFGEDPYLTGRMGVAYVKGLQGDDPRYLKVAATLKHYAVNNVEADRMKLDAKVSERMLHEYWLPHFRDAVVEGGACSLMASYNAINGTPNNINHWLLTDLLKKDWGHEGFVVSDLGGVRTMVEGHEKGAMSYVDAVARSLMAGCDFSDREFEENIPKAVREGKLSLERLDDAVTRVLRVRFRLGEFDPFESVPYSRIPPEVIGSEEHRAIARKAAQQSIVLLQNRDGLLPLDKGKLKRIAVLGPLANEVVTNGYNGRHEGTVSPLAGIIAAAGKDIEVVHETGTDVRGHRGVPNVKVDREDGFSGGASVKLEATAVGDFIEFPVEVAKAGRYRLTLDYKAFGERGRYQLSIDGRLVGQPVDMYRADPRYGVSAEYGERELSAGAHAFRFTVVGKNGASGGFPGHFDRLRLRGTEDVSIELERAKATSGRTETTGDPLAKAAWIAKAADVALVFVGTDRTVEQEARDRRSLGLPGEQEELVRRVVAANPRTVVVQMSAGPLTVPWLKEHVPAMLQAWWPGGEGGHALADVLFGEVNPAGRLPHTVYASEEQVPPIDEYDIRKGFTYMYVKGEPLYPFGHGLSYTSFAYWDFKATPEAVPAEGAIDVSVEVKNRGSRDGDEVVQLYVRAVNPSVDRPAKELRGFQRIHLKAGEEKNVGLTVPAEKLAYYDENRHAFVVEPGEYEIMVGASSADIRQRATVRVSKP